MGRYAVDDWLSGVRPSALKRFYPTAVAKATGLSTADVFQRLLVLTGIGWIHLAWEVHCPQCNTILDRKQVSDPMLLYDMNLSCNDCGLDEIEVCADIIFPIFLIDEEWRQTFPKKVQAASGRIRSSAGGATSLSGLLDSGTLPGGAMEFSSRSGPMFVNFGYMNLGDLSFDHMLNEASRCDDLRPYVEEIRELLSKEPRNKAERNGKVKRLNEIAQTLVTMKKAVVEYGPLAITLANTLMNYLQTAVS
jgi:hypothetical protein